MTGHSEVKRQTVRATKCCLKCPLWNYDEGVEVFSSVIPNSVWRIVKYTSVGYGLKSEKELVQQQQKHPIDESSTASPSERLRFRGLQTESKNRWTFDKTNLRCGAHSSLCVCGGGGTVVPTLLILLVLGSVWLMCRSVYLRGLLMSHGTDSVRTKRAGRDRIRRKQQNTEWGLWADEIWLSIREGLHLLKFLNGLNGRWSLVTIAREHLRTT
jgi:hypothetical protein